MHSEYPMYHGSEQGPFLACRPVLTKTGDRGRTADAAQHGMTNHGGGRRRVHSHRDNSNDNIAHGDRREPYMMAA